MSSAVKTLSVGLGLAAMTAMTASAATTFVEGYLKYEYYPGKSRVDVETGAAGAPSSGGTVVGSDKGGIISSAEAGTNFAEDYSNRIFGYFIAPADGDYVFFIAGDDDSDLFLSTDADPANKKLIANESQWSGVRSWTSTGGGPAENKRSDQFAGTEWPTGAQITLVKGNKYYLDIVHHEGGGGDNIAVTYKMAADPDPKNGDAPKLFGPVIGYDADAPPPASTLSITSHPAGGDFYVGGSFSMSVTANTDSSYAIFYQWRKNGVAIPGANSRTFGVGVVGPGDAGTYDVQVSVPDTTGKPKTVTSNPAVVNVLSSPLLTGWLKYEYFPGGDRAAVYGGGLTPSYAGNTVGSDKSGYIQIAESGRDFADNYANRISGLFVAPEDGNYIFLVYADDDTDVFLSTDESPANKKLIARETNWSDFRRWNTRGDGVVEAKNSSTFAGSEWPTPNVITLVKGNKYYIETVHHEGGGGDRLGLTYRLETEDEALTADNTAPRLTGSVIASYVPPQTINITSQPASTTVYDGTPARFEIVAVASGSFPVTYQWRRNGVNIGGATTSRYSFVTDVADSGAKFDVVMTTAGATVTSAEATLTVNPASIEVAGKLKREFFPGSSRAQVRDGRVGAPATVTALNSFEAPVNVADNYSQRVSGYFTPAVTGAYVFFVAGDDDSDLWVSTDDKPINKKLVARQTSWGNNREWVTAEGGGITDPDTRVTQKRSDKYSPDGGTTFPYSSGINLVAGTKYYIEGIHHEGGGGDNFAATFKLLADPDPANDDPSAFTGAVISYLTGPVSTATISQQPASFDQYEAQSGGLSVTVNTDSELTPLYQWRKNGVDIPGATARTFNIGFLATTDSGEYDVVVTIPNYTPGPVTSSKATINVFPAPLITGLLKYEYFPGATRAQVLAGTAGSPKTDGWWVGGNQSGFITIGEAANDFADNYANRISGFFIPPTTGDYVFFVNGDDDTDLFLSTDDKPANKKLIAREAGWSGVRAWNGIGGAPSVATDKRSDSYGGTQWPSGNTITLTANQLYYIEAVHAEGGGGDNFGITYKKAEDPDPADRDASDLKGSVVGVKVIPQALGTTAPTVTSAIGTLKDITLTFSAPINPSTLTAGNFNLGAGVTVNSVSSREIFEGASIVTIATVNATGLQSCRTYSVAVSSAVKDTKGNSVASGYSVPVLTPCLTLDFNDGTLPTEPPVVAGGSGAIASDLGPDGSAVFMLTDNVNSQQGALRIGDLVAGQPVKAFTATFDLYIGNGSGNAADGMSFNFGNIPDSVLSVGEEGTGTISVNFDTFDNGALGGSGPASGRREAPAFEVKLNGSIIGHVSLSKAAIVNDQWVKVVVALNPDNSITTIYNGLTYFNHLSLNNPIDLTTGNPVASYTPISGGVFLIGGRTGGENARQMLDNVTIVETVASVEPPKPEFTKITLNSNGSITVEWTGGGTLQATTALVPGAVWTDVTGATSPYTFTPTAGVPTLYGRIRQ